MAILGIPWWGWIIALALVIGIVVVVLRRRGGGTKKAKGKQNESGKTSGVMTLPQVLALTNGKKPHITKRRSSNAAMQEWLAKYPACVVVWIDIPKKPDTPRRVILQCRHPDEELTTHLSLHFTLVKKKNQPLQVTLDYFSESGPGKDAFKEKQAPVELRHTVISTLFSDLWLSIRTAVEKEKTAEASDTAVVKVNPHKKPAPKPAAPLPKNVSRPSPAPAPIADTAVVVEDNPDNIFRN